MAGSVAPMSTDLVLRADRFLIQQDFKPLLNQYRISIPADGSTEPGEDQLVVKQKRMKIKEDIRFRLPSQGDDAHEFAIKAKTVTYDFARLMEGATLVKCSEFGKAIVKHMG